MGGPLKRKNYLMVNMLYKRCTIAQVYVISGPDFMDLLHQKMLLNNFLLKINELATGHRRYMQLGMLAGTLILLVVFA